MDRLFLEKPAITRKEDAIRYLQEHVACRSAMNGTGSMDRCLTEMTYEEWLIELERRNDPAYCRQINRDQSKTFFCCKNRRQQDRRYDQCPV